MDNSWLKLRLLHALIAFVIASVVSVGFAWLGLRASILYFAHAAPHDGQGVLGAIYVGIFAGIFGWIVVFWQCMHWQGVLAWRRREAQIALESQSRYTITGRRSI